MVDPTTSQSCDGPDFIEGPTRRQLIKYLGAAGVPVSLAGCVGSSDDGSSDGGDGDGGSQEKLKNPLESDRYADLAPIKGITDSTCGPLFDMFGPSIEEESGLQFADQEMMNVAKTYQKVNSEFVKPGESSWDVIQIVPLYLGDYQSRDVLEPLDKYFDRFERMDKYWGQVLPVYKDFYAKFNGDIVGLPVDGDILNLHYRPSYFEDETHKQQYKDEYGQELRVPQTWPEFNQVAKYFTENTKDGVYGAQIYGGKPWTWAYFMNRAASKGIIYFDKEMTPLINKPEAVDALENMVETIQYAPPGSEQFGNPETSSHWQQGKVVMTEWWLDVAEYTAQGDYPVVGDQANAQMPGWKQDGEITRTSTMAFNRILSVPSDIPDERKEAAFYAAMRICHQDYSLYHVADAFTATDPYMDVHFSEKGIKQYTKPDPKRDTGPGFESNPPTFEDMEMARQHVEGARKNLQIGFPQMNWPGAVQYINPFATHIQNALAGEEEPKEALDNVASKWKQTVDELGREKQKKHYQQFLKKGKEHFPFLKHV